MSHWHWLDAPLKTAEPGELPETYNKHPFFTPNTSELQYYISFENLLTKFVLPPQTENKKTLSRKTGFCVKLPGQFYSLTIHQHKSSRTSHHHRTLANPPHHSHANHELSSKTPCVDLCLSRHDHGARQ